jgi:hypothetical protein
MHIVIPERGRIGHLVAPLSRSGHWCHHGSLSSAGVCRDAGNGALTLRVTVKPPRSPRRADLHVRRSHVQVAEREAGAGRAVAEGNSGVLPRASYRACCPGRRISGSQRRSPRNTPPCRPRRVLGRCRGHLGQVLREGHRQVPGSRVSTEAGTVQSPGIAGSRDGPPPGAAIRLTISGGMHTREHCSRRSGRPGTRGSGSRDVGHRMTPARVRHCDAGTRWASPVGRRGDNGIQYLPSRRGRAAARSDRGGDA